MESASSEGDTTPVSEGERIISIKAEYIPAKPMYEAARYCEKSLMYWLSGLDIPNPLEKFAIQIIRLQHGGSGTHNRIPDDVMKIIQKLNGVG